MENRKYELAEDDFIIYKGKKLYRIRALRTISKIVSKGALGGYVEGYYNLSQEGDCWIFNDAMVYGNAIVEDGAVVGEDTKVFGNARVKDIAMVVGSANIYGNASIEGGSLVRVGKFYDNVAIKNSTDISIPVECHNNTVISTAIKYPVS